ncbi:S8 family serine peptidase [Oceanicella sp. SM1341]|uniref:S8 family serine peptidase n=1 Tax=Oceanicella sp. SM1341 TaxID=1548889 RepID=UPI000E4F8822|nr:S8 family serine peptidase [Oceanicella sp. SM1341]
MKTARITLRNTPRPPRAAPATTADGAPASPQAWTLVGPGESAEAARAGLARRAERRTDLVTPQIRRSATGLPQRALAPGEIADGSAALPILSMDSMAHAAHWSSAKAGQSAFGTAREAMRAIGAPWAAAAPFRPEPGLDGEGVNVVIVDEGLTESYLRSLVPGLNFMGGLVDLTAGRADPGRFSRARGAAHSWHGNMIARNILRIAPRVKLWDAPLLPDRVADIPAFTDDADDLLEGLEAAVDARGGAAEPWVVVNAWAVADSIMERDLPLPPGRRYTDGRQNEFNEQVAGMAARFDFVFAAGNFGTFAPDSFAGLYDCGPGRSIKGANALPEVLCVGATTVQGDWVGASSMGPGPAALAGGAENRKPDLCAPSWFSEPDDRGQLSTGTSAAAAVAAGLVAALRTTERTMPSAELFARLRDHALRPRGTGWDARMGHGLLCRPGA